MTTARERMIELGGLPGAHSARAHFLAITQGTGTGVDRTLFASQFSVQIEEPTACAVQHTKREARKAYRVPISKAREDAEYAVSVLLRDAELCVLTDQDALTILHRNTNDVVVRDLGDDRFTVRQGDILNMAN